MLHFHKSKFQNYGILPLNGKYLPLLSPKIQRLNLDFISRDFILISKIGRKGKEWLQGGCSVNYTEPENKNAKNVRAWNGPGGTFVRHTSDPNKVIIFYF